MKITATSITQAYLQHIDAVHVSDYQDYMDNGPGRFATGAQFTIVSGFFNPPSGTTFTPGVYSKQEIANALGISNRFGLFIKQREFQDGIDDYGDRTYIWNSQSYKIVDDAEFVVTEDGQKYIRNFAIEYWEVPGEDQKPVPENFDLKSGDGDAQIGNTLVLKPCIDPKGEGKKVIIKFDGELRRRMYTAEDLANDQRKIEKWTILDSPLDLPITYREVVKVRDRVIREASIPYCLNNKQRGFHLRVSSESSVGTMMQCLSDNWHSKSFAIGDTHNLARDRSLNRTIPSVLYDDQQPGRKVGVKGIGVNDTFEVQVEQQSLPWNKQVSANTAVAMGLRNSTLQISLQPRNIICSTDGNDNIFASDTTNNLIYGGKDLGSVGFSGSGNVVLTGKDGYYSPSVGYYIKNATAPYYNQTVPVYGQIMWAVSAT